MGCWGITAFESDAGLDAAGFIRHNLPEDGKLELDKIIKTMRKEKKLTLIPDVTEGWSHSGPMVLAEIIVKFADQDFSNLDYDEDWAADEKKFKSITSFVATRESIQWLRDYLSETLNHKLADVEWQSKQGYSDWDKWGGLV